jgi:hypothetical protein
MAVFRRGSAPFVAPLVVVLAILVAVPRFVPSIARADAPASTCRVVNVDFTPGGIPAGKRLPPGSDPTKVQPVQSAAIVPQIVAWIEQPTGAYVSTIYITQQTGRYGMGNRPGRFDFNSGPRWPYGRRVTVFPVWANKQPVTFPQINYNNNADSDLSHPFNESSSEAHFCRPIEPTESAWDGVTCSSTVYTDKGVFGSAVSHYPPRADVTATGGLDSPSVPAYKAMNVYDAVSQASPQLGEHTQINWSIPATVAAGDYVLVMEVALEQDFNDTYTVAAAPAPTGISYNTYGVPYRGQPSVIYQVPFTIATDGDTVNTTDAYAGYGDPTGADGKIRPRDATISEAPNTGGGRLLLTSDSGQMFRVRVSQHTEQDVTAPSAPSDMLVTNAGSRNITVQFAAPGDDGMTGTVQGYEVRYLAGDTPITADNFDTANEAPFDAQVVAAGQSQQITVNDLLPETTYTVAVRAYDNCHNVSVITSMEVTTAARESGEVDACFVATAAYGSVLANDVELLRRFRDALLRRSVLGELAVETYYTFGPPVAGVVGESDLLREAARAALMPLVGRVRSLRW